ncbi:MAG: hypothetical protein ABIN45_04305, partial [Gammaproteobacteria bacterium]
IRCCSMRADLCDRLQISPRHRAIYLKDGKMGTQQSAGCTPFELPANSVILQEVKRGTGESKILEKHLALEQTIVGTQLMVGN